MTANGVLAVRYAERETTLSEVYYRWPSYGEPDGPLDMAYYFWIIQPPAGPPVVVDSGFEPQRGARMGRNCTCEPADALARLGIDAAAVQQVVVTHLHYDHIGNLGLFGNAELVVAQRELDFWTDPIAARPHFAEHTDAGAVAGLERAAAAGRVRAVDDELEVAPGIVALRVGGHSPGQLVLSVSTAGGGVVLASDAVHYYDELVTERPFAVLHDLADVYRAYDTVRALASDGREMIPGHDPLVMERYPSVERAGPALAVQVA
jgi:glyoxylase-like metal-dependent hydrolase (beta-lactamase superfamily II)